jgi:hypothetical protein
MAAVKKIGLLATTLILGSMSATSFGQATPPPGGNNGGNPPANNGGGRNRNFDPAQFRQRMLDRVKQQLGASDEEFTALSPKIEKVIQLQRDAGGRGGFGRRGGGQGGQGGTPPPAPTTPQSAVQTASTELQTTLDNKDSKPEEIKAKLDALRAAKAQAKQDLAGAQQELKGLLTQRQEAVLVEMGMLD